MTKENNEIRNALNMFDIEQARTLLREALKTPSAETYYLASLAALTDKQRLDFLKKALDLDPFHAEALAALEAGGQKASKQNSVEVIQTEPDTPVEQNKQGEKIPPPTSKTKINSILIPLLPAPGTTYC
ncbi:MAG: hypothetical protein KDE59_03175 [Anaerolineales bacterium]|nr:hypothetical protein [Anaerolineales bacterium]